MTNNFLSQFVVSTFSRLDDIQESNLVVVVAGLHQADVEAGGVLLGAGGLLGLAGVRGREELRHGQLPPSHGAELHCNGNCVTCHVSRSRPGLGHTLSHCLCLPTVKLVGGNFRFKKFQFRVRQCCIVKSDCIVIRMEMLQQHTHLLLCRHPQ